jgi:hypothetical protein
MIWMASCRSDGLRFVLMTGTLESGIGPDSRVETATGRTGVARSVFNRDGRIFCDVAIDNEPEGAKTIEIGIEHLRKL